MTGSTRYYCFSASGRRFYIGTAKQAVDLRDIAAQLAKINRFAGATLPFYSVAQHAVLVSQIVMAMPGATALVAMQALHHDDHEMISSDIPVPFRLAVADAVGRDVIAELQDEIDATIYAALGIPLPQGHAAALVAKADKIAYATEIRDVLPGDADTWDWGSRPDAWKRILKPVPWHKAEDLFVARHNELVMLCGGLLDQAA